MRSLSPRAGLAQSLRIKQQRDELTALGARLGTEVLFLKGAWADPVLYDGRGERWSNDIDILVRPATYLAFGHALEAVGFVPRRVATHTATLAAQKAQLYHAPDDRLPVDLHRGLVEEPWFRLDPAGCMARAVTYDSVDGPVPSLCPADQLLFAAAHYASHGLELDGRHRDDMARMLQRFPIATGEVAAAAERAGLGSALGWLSTEIRRAGGDVPPALLQTSLAGRARLGAAGRVATSRLVRQFLPETKRRVLELTLISDRRGAAAAFLWRYLRLRRADRRQPQSPP